MDANDLLKSALRDILDKLENGGCSPEETSEALELLVKMANDQTYLNLHDALKLLNIGKTKFYELIAAGKIPHGTHDIGNIRVGWKRSDLLRAKSQLKKERLI